MAKADFTFGCRILTPDSSWIEYIQYDPKNFVLEMKTKKGDRYRYYDLKHKEWAFLSCSDSVGKYFNEHVKTKYRRRKVKPEAPALQAVA